MVTVSPSGTEAPASASRTAPRADAFYSDVSYTMDHTPYVMLFDRNGAFVQTIAYREETATAVDKLRALIAAG